VLRAHENRTTYVAIDRRGKLVATASADTTVRLWRLDSGDLLATLRGHTKQVNWVGFTADHQLVSTAADGTARLWDPERALETAVFAHGSFVMHANIDPTGRRLATASWTDGTVKIWNLERRPRIAVFADPDARYQHQIGGALVAGSTLVRYGPAGIAAWDLATNTPLWQRAHAGTTAAQLDRNGAALVVGDRAGKILKIAARTGTVLHSIDHGSPVRAVALHPDGDRVACSDASGRIAIWGIASTTRLASRVVGEVGALAFFDGGAGLVAFQPTDDAGKVVWLLDVDRELAQRALLGHTDVVFAVEVSPDGKTLATGAWDGWVRLWDASGAAIGAFHEDGGVGIIRWSPDGERIVTGSAAGSISVWNRAGMRLAHVTGHAAFTFSLAVDPRGLLLASAGGDHLIKIWDLDTLVPLFQFGSGNDYADHVIFHDADLVSSSPAGTDVWRF